MAWLPPLSQLLQKSLVADQLLQQVEAAQDHHRPAHTPAWVSDGALCSSANCSFPELFAGAVKRQLGRIKMPEGDATDGEQPVRRTNSAMGFSICACQAFRSGDI
jgi:hypothetical protein